MLVLVRRVTHGNSAQLPMMAPLGLLIASPVIPGSHDLTQEVIEREVVRGDTAF